MALSAFQKQDNLIKRFMEKCDIDSRYSITLVARNIWNIHDTKSHNFTLNYFINGKKKNGYGLLSTVYYKYEQDKRFELIQGSENICVMQYKPN